MKDKDFKSFLKYLSSFSIPDRSKVPQEYYRAQMHEPREGDGGDYDDIDCHPDYDAKTDSIKKKTDI